MNDQAMGLPIFDEAELLQEDVSRFERELKEAKSFSDVWNDEKFQSSVMDSVLGSEAEKLAVSLLEVGMTDDRMQEVLFELKSLRFIKNLLKMKANDLDKVEARLKAANKLLFDVMSNNKD